MNGNPKSPVSPTSNTTTRPIKVDDAMNYLDAVKYQFIEKPEVYNCFLNVMKDFKHGTIEASDVIKKVSRLFHGHPVLLEGFNQFLPAGHRIDPSTGAIQPPGR
ncbi:hypothetical protein AMATHDRAFT_150049 [Amanita thiersii Skay4041]|uniref:Histone deacetylase interacting domain-containing protein n=1 Tax=Amanita thiersii Skay4041 TaxID=703135 RepID=A0A2A9NKZ7_9AGAR|nr:hypothetical protein AMATHDRAFT_150049 [Amanita thiersii Skay4041]